MRSPWTDKTPEAQRWRFAMESGRFWFESYREASQMKFGFAMIPRADLAFCIQDALTVIALEALYA